LFTDQNGLNAVLWAADRGHVDCVNVLVAAGIDINVADQVSTVSGLSPSHDPL
jgi:ankyrin repeat protein